MTALGDRLLLLLVAATGLSLGFAYAVGAVQAFVPAEWERAGFGLLGVCFLVVVAGAWLVVRGPE